MPAYQTQPEPLLPRPIRLGLMGGAAFVGAVLFFSVVSGTYYTVDQGEQALVLTNGAVSDVSGPGLHFKAPFIQHIVKVTMRTQTDSWHKQGNDDYRLSAYSKDQQPATIAVSVTYAVVNSKELYSRYGTSQDFEHKILDRRVPEQLKNVFGGFTAQEAIQDRAKLNARVQDAIKAATHGEPVVVESVQIEDITFSDAYESAVEARMTAIVKQQQAEADKQKRMIDADAGAYEQVAKAKADGEAARLRGEGEAAGIEARGRAIRENPQVTALMYAEAAKRWDGALPTTMVPGSAVPFVNVGGGH